MRGKKQDAKKPAEEEKGGGGEDGERHESSVTGGGRLELTSNEKDTSSLEKRRKAGRMPLGRRGKVWARFQIGEGGTKRDLGAPNLKENQKNGSGYREVSKKKRGAHRLSM